MVALLYKFKLLILIMDRFDVYLLPVVNVKDQPNLLIQLVLGIFLAQDNELGIEYSGNFNDFHLTVQGTKFWAQCWPFVASIYNQLVGCGTTCWRATWANESKRPLHWPDAQEEEFPLVIESL